jgi:hypothetical protein
MTSRAELIKQPPGAIVKTVPSVSVNVAVSPHRALLGCSNSPEKVRNWL